MRHLQTLHEEYRSEGLVILGFNCSDDKRIALEFLRENSATFPTILDSSPAAQRTVSNDYGSGGGIPLNYIIDPKGKVVDAWYGGEEQHPRALKALRSLGIELPD